MTTPFSPVVVNGTTISTMKSGVTLNKGQVATPSYTSRADRFWASASALIGDPSREVLEIAFAAAGITNLVSFDAVQFPHTILIEYSDSTANNWQPLLDPFTHQPVEITILKSYPPILPDPSTVAGHVHPQHDYEGHWVRYEVPCQTTQIQKMRFILQRYDNGAGPLNATGQKIAYSLALQNIDTAYTVGSEDDIPFHLDETDSDTSGEVFANSADLFGSNLGFSKKTYRASNLVYNTDENAPLLWKSEPQPFPEAVVNFYADMRTSTGKSQLIDRIFIDPLHLGTTINVYYSNDHITGQWKSPRRSLRTGRAVVHNSSKVTQGGPLDLGTWHASAGANPAYFDPFSAQINNSAVGFDYSLDWWIGIEWTRNWNINTDSNNHVLFDCEYFQIGSNNGSFYVSTTAGDSVVLPNTTADNVPIQIVAGYTVATGGLHLSVQQLGVSQSLDLGLSAIPPTNKLPQQLIIGSDQGQTLFSGGMITAFVLQQQARTDDGFLSNPQGYSSVPLLRKGEKLSAYNTLLRLDTSQVSGNASGFIGGSGKPYAQMSWTPIPRSYEAQRGYIKLPPTKARYWNLEFTNLRPEVNEKFVPVTRKVKTFPARLFKTTNPSTSATDTVQNSEIGLTVQQNSPLSNLFNDRPQFQGTGGGSMAGVTNTEVYVAKDWETQQRLAQVSNDWRYVKLHPEKGAVKFHQVGLHDYDIQSIRQTSNVSFFAGLRRIVFGRSVRTAPQNHAVIVESFGDSQYLPTGNWVVTDDSGLWSGDTAGPSYAKATSVTTPTLTAVRGVQFAAQQSDAKPISVDGEFSSSDYDPSKVVGWSAYGDGRPQGLNFNASIGQYALLVSRRSDHGFWGDIPVNYGPTYGSLAGVTYGTLSQGQAVSLYEGGVRSRSIAAPIGGRIHAAARVTASQTLSAPLYAQVVDAKSGQVLAEAQSNVAKNQIQQWYASLNLAQFGSVIGRTWKQVAGNDTRWPTFTDTFTRANSSSLGRMDSGQSWNVPSGNVSFTISANKAVSTSATAGNSMSAGTPWGTLSVRYSTVATTAVHASAVNLLNLGDIYLMNDGTINDSDQNYIFGTISETLSTAHDYNFKFMKTSQVPGGQVPAGVDPTVQQYSIVISTGTLGSDTWLQTISLNRMPTGNFAIYGPSGTAYTKFAWAPSNTQVPTVSGYIPASWLPSSSAGYTDNGGNIYTFTNPTTGSQYTTQGQYTAGQNVNPNNQAISLRPSGTIVTSPATFTVTPTATGGSFASGGTYFWTVTSVNQYGESPSLFTTSAAITAGGFATLSWAAQTGASSYNIYRGTSGTVSNLYLVGNSGTTGFVDVGDATPGSSSGVPTPPTYNTTNGAGTMMVTDSSTNYGTLRISVKQMPSNMSAVDVRLAYLDYSPEQGQVLTLRGDGSVWNDYVGTQVGSIGSLSPTAGPIDIHFVNVGALSTTFRTANPTIVNYNRAILVYQNVTTFKGFYAAATPWLSTVRGIGGANNGISAGQYTIIEGFNFNPDAAILVSDTTAPTWGQVTLNSTRTYGEITRATSGSTQNLFLRILQKTPTNDSWFVQSATFFWDPIVWEFSCDNGATWWEGSDIRNNPNGVLLFPYGLTDYTHLKWRLTAHAGREAVSHLAIRPWYSGRNGHVMPLPSHVPSGPNTVPSEDYGPIEQDPRWLAWDKPVPRSWWSGGTVAR
jgi:hypothetical protein